MLNVVASQSQVESVRVFLDEFFGAWQGTDIEKIMDYYSDDVVIQLPTGTLTGKTAVRDNFVVPFVAGFPGNVHTVQMLAHAENLVAVEWKFEAVHTGEFLGIQPTGREVDVPGCSFYEHRLDSRRITAGRIYFDVGTLLRQIGVAA
jgi:steroid delta-isomerase-like uncharacterized protein